MKRFLFLLLSAVPFLVAAQDRPPDHISLSPVSITGLGGIQSYAFGQINGEWVIIGGRLDGLHRRQPFAAFDLAGHNTTIWVVDPTNDRLWTAPLASLPANLREPLSATNPEFYQENTTLLIIGGYGYSPSLGDHTTFPTLTVLDLPTLIAAVKEGTSILPAFQQLRDEKFAVTGGRLAKIYETWYLVGGQKFEGRYNPMGPDHGPGFTQVYTDQVRRFSLLFGGDTIAVEHLTDWTDEAHLHRRDYNVVPQILPNGEEGLTAFSGVFRRDADLPFLQPVDIDSSGHTVNFDFLQYYNHYHCPTIPLYAEGAGQMHTLFFGGIAQFYPGENGRIQDDNVPFVKTITRVTRMSSGEMEEVPLPQRLPAFLGAGAEFIPREDLPTFPNGVIRMDDLNVPPGDSLLLGYIFGGIRSSAENIFFVNDGTQSDAHNRAYAVYLHNATSTALRPEPGPAVSGFRVYPNPNQGSFRITFSTREPLQNVQLSVYDLLGQRIASKALAPLSVGDHQLEWQHKEKLVPGNYLLQLTRGTQVLVSGKLVVHD